MSQALLGRGQLSFSSSSLSVSWIDAYLKAGPNFGALFLIGCLVVYTGLFTGRFVIKSCAFCAFAKLHSSEGRGQKPASSPSLSPGWIERYFDDRPSYGRELFGGWLESFTGFSLSCEYDNGLYGSWRESVLSLCVRSSWILKSIEPDLNRGLWCKIVRSVRLIGLFLCSFS